MKSTKKEIRNTHMGKVRADSSLIPRGDYEELLTLLDLTSPHWQVARMFPLCVETMITMELDKRNKCIREGKLKEPQDSGAELLWLMTSMLRARVVGFYGCHGFQMEAQSRVCSAQHTYY
jgi:hypothetical protein